MNERRGSSAALRAAASLIIGRELRLGLTQRKVIDAAERAEVTSRALEWQRIDVRLAGDVTLGEPGERKAPVVQQRLPVAGIAEVDPHAVGISPHAHADVAAVAPAAVLDCARCEHDECECTQAVGVSESVQRQLRIARSTWQNIEPAARPVNATDLVVDQQLPARRQLVDAIRSQSNRQPADRIPLGGLREAHRERGSQLFEREQPQNLTDGALDLEGSEPMSIANIAGQRLRRVTLSAVANLAFESAVLDCEQLFL